MAKRNLIPDSSISVVIARVDREGTASLILETLKRAFPQTKFALTFPAYVIEGPSLDVRWTDGPCASQVTPILDRFSEKTWAGRQDLAYHCMARRVWRGQLTDFHTGYARATRMHSLFCLTTVAREVCIEVGCEVPEIRDSEHGACFATGHDAHVPFQWHEHWRNNEPLHIGDIEHEWAGKKRRVVASDPHGGEWLTALIQRIAEWVSWESMEKIELPEYPGWNS